MSTKEMGNDVLTKEEKEALLNKKMEEIRKKNEALQKRHQEILADKQQAEKAGSMVNLRCVSDSPPIAHKDMRGVTPPKDGVGAPKGKLSQGRGKRLQAMKENKDRGGQEDNRPPRQQTQQGYSPPKSRLKKDEQQQQQQQHQSKNQDVSKLSMGRGRRLAKMKNESSNNPSPANTNPQGPPPEPGYSFLQDRSREGPLPDASRQDSRESRGGGQRHPRNYGGHDLSQVKMRIKNEREKQNRYSAPVNSKWEMEMKMTGKERKEYQDWKQEREAIDRDRVNRQKNSQGNWTREWDLEKRDGEQPSRRRVGQFEDYLPQGSGQQGPMRTNSQEDESWDSPQQASFTRRPPSPPQSRRMEPARRPAGRIGSGRFAQTDEEELAQLLAMSGGGGGGPMPGGAGPISPKAGGGSGRFLDRGVERGGKRGGGHRNSYHDDYNTDTNRPRYSSQGSQGSDDGSRTVEEQNDRLLIKIENEIHEDMNRRGRGGSGRGGYRGGRGAGGGERGGRGGGRGGQEYHAGGRGGSWRGGGEGGSWRGGGDRGASRGGGGAGRGEPRPDGVVMRRAWDNEFRPDPEMSDGGQALARGKRPRGRKQHRPLSYTEGYTFATITTSGPGEDPIKEVLDEPREGVISPKSQESGSSGWDTIEEKSQDSGTQWETHQDESEDVSEERENLPSNNESKPEMPKEQRPIKQRAEKKAASEEKDDEWEDAEETVEYGDSDQKTDVKETMEFVDHDLHNSSAESLERFIQEHTLDIDLESGTVQKKSHFKDKTPELPKLKTDRTPPSGSSITLSSPDNLFLKTPEGHVKVLDWGADVEEEYGHMLSPELRKTLGLPSPEIDHETAQKLNMSISSSEAESPVKKDISAGEQSLQNNKAVSNLAAELDAVELDDEKEEVSEASTAKDSSVVEKTIESDPASSEPPSLADELAQPSEQDSVDKQEGKDETEECKVEETQKEGEDVSKPEIKEENEKDSEVELENKDNVEDEDNVGISDIKEETIEDKSKEMNNASSLEGKNEGTMKQVEEEVKEEKVDNEMVVDEVAESQPVSEVGEKPDSAVDDQEKSTSARSDAQQTEEIPTKPENSSD